MNTVEALTQVAGVIDSEASEATSVEFGKGMAWASFLVREYANGVEESGIDRDENPLFLKDFPVDEQFPRQVSYGRDGSVRESPRQSWPCYATGGKIQGPPPASSDDIPIWASPGYVVAREVYDRLAPVIDINSRRK